MRTNSASNIIKINLLTNDIGECMFYENNKEQIIVQNLSVQLSNINSPWLHPPKIDRLNSGRKVLQFKSVF